MNLGLKSKMLSFPLVNTFALWCNPANTDALREKSREKNKNVLKALSDEVHLRETASWLVRAQDQHDDQGVSRSYRAAVADSSRAMGWLPSYPETTGYIIPTFFALATHLNESSYASRALSMADWEIDIQLPSGAVMGSVVTARPSPAVFNTGQVIFGWLAAYKQSGDQKYLDAARKAGGFLVSVLTPEGSWSQGDSQFALKGATTYNTRVAWALIELGTVTQEEKYIAAGRKNIDHALSQQLPNGWFQNNCLNDPEHPLLHTIVYATRGVLESGLCLKDSRYIEAARKTLDALVNCQRPDGGISGRLGQDWSPAASWDCLTGDAQVAIAWQRLSAYCGDEKYMQAARAAVEFVKKTQNLEHENLGIRGGVKGSFPFDGEYGQYELLNWAAKFFCDALLLASSEEYRSHGITG